MNPSIMPAINPNIPAKVEYRPLYDDIYRVADRTAPHIMQTNRGFDFLNILPAIGIEIAYDACIEYLA